MSKKNILIATIKEWNIKNVRLMNIPNYSIHLITKKEELSESLLNEINPEYVFFIHWSWYIPETVYTRYECMVFHPADVPYGRGGSPIQNLIYNGHDRTTISAIKIVKELDSGPVYMKRDGLSLEGTVEEILMRMSEIVCFDMIPTIIRENPVPKEQVGEPVVFKRRNKEQNKICFSDGLKQIYNLIRMLDGEGYPNAYYEAGDYRLTFNRAGLHTDYIEANVVIKRRDMDE